MSFWRVFFLLLTCFLATVIGIRHTCGEERCECEGNSAHCVLTFHHMFIPKLPERITDLSLTGVDRIDNASFFLNVTHITSLKFVPEVLSFIAPGAFDILDNLTSLDISSNLLTSLPENTFRKATRQRLLKFDASGNPFNCDCDLMWLGKWMRSCPSVFVDSESEYTCLTYSLEKRIKTLYMAKQACLLSEAVTIVLITACSGILFYFVIGVGALTIRSVCSRKEAVDEVVYVLSYRPRKPGQRKAYPRNVQFEYDVFIAYAEEDKDLVFNHLLPELEGRLGLKLCLHQRDFRPGRYTVGNIADSVERSKKVMMVFSTHFARSPWCQFELSLCQHHAMDHSDELIVIHVKNTLECELTPSMAAIVRTHTYIPWAERGESRAMFWNSLLLALGGVIPAAPRQQQNQLLQMKEAEIV